jgi:hypothetical protein
LPEDDYFTELLQLQMAFKVEIYDGKLRDRKMERKRWEKMCGLFLFL